MLNEDNNNLHVDATSHADNTSHADSAPTGENPQPVNPPNPPQNPGYTAVQPPYYEAWQQPVYRNNGTAGQGAYSPSFHAGATVERRGVPDAETHPAKEPRKRKGFGFVKAVILVLACALASGGATYGVIQLSAKNGMTNTVNQVVLGADPSQDAGDGNQPAQQTTPGAPVPIMSSTAVYEMAVNQVVGVNSEGMTTNVFGQGTPSAVSGSGFIVSEDGFIVTNYHVIQFAADQNFSLTVMLHDGSSYPAKIIGYEPDNDLAVIKIDATGLSAVKLGSNKNMKVGDTVYAIGNPLGELDYTMTSGIVSALDRVIQVDESTSINMFQIDAAVNSGNSGGPVYNSSGEVIGIVSAKYASTGVEGLGFAIPIDDALNIVSQLITTGHVSGKPSMGISVSEVTAAQAEYYNLHVGAYVESVQRGSAADKAGIKVGDIIIKLGDEEVTSPNTLKLAKKQYSAGETTPIVVFREGQEVTLSITFDEEGVTQTSAQITVPQQLPAAERVDS